MWCRKRVLAWLCDDDVTAVIQIMLDSNRAKDARARQATQQRCALSPTRERGTHNRPAFQLCTGHQCDNDPRFSIFFALRILSTPFALCILVTKVEANTIPAMLKTVSKWMEGQARRQAAAEDAAVADTAAQRRGAYKRQCLCACFSMRTQIASTACTKRL
eukprot:TRINITY_DN1037_c1_g1_i3.p1 TRINITY_DN1037_c1_g1~~TRINITY_DN1037_c1_g1_i3.p1  ORF type:complete len:161 (+),score=5.37 TRINITY_DN1037_c1_g1_i3:276-758(+)